MEIVIEPSLPLLEITPRCWTDCCVADCGGFCIKHCDDCAHCDNCEVCNNCDDCSDCWVNFG